MHLAGNSIVCACKDTVYIPQDNGIIMFSPITLNATKYNNATRSLLDLCSVQCSIHTLHRRGCQLGMTASLDEYKDILLDLFGKGFIYIDGKSAEPVNDLNYYKGIAKNSHKPKTAAVHITYKCNKDCIYCYNKEHRDSIDSSTLSTSEWRSIFNKLFDAGIRDITITGGEPMLRLDIIDMLKKMNLSDVKLAMITNASLIDEKNIVLLDELFSSVTISIDSSSQETADMLRGVGTYGSVLKAMKLLSKCKNIVWTANVVLTKYNIDSYEKTYDWLKENHCKHITPIIQTVRNEEKNESYPSLHQIEQFLEKRYRDIMNPKNRLDIEEDLSKSRSYSISQRVACTAASSECAIDPLGYIYPCRMLMHKKLRSEESLLHREFDYIWNRDAVLCQVREGLPLPAECKSCPYFNLCIGECHGHRLLKTGDFMTSTSTEMCTIIKQIITHKIVANIHHSSRKMENV